MAEYNEDSPEYIEHIKSIPLEIPGVEEIKKMDIPELHSVWCKNHEVLRGYIEQVGFDSIPFLATHGTFRESKDIEEAEPYEFFIWEQEKALESTDEALKLLYELANNSSHYSVDTETRDLVRVLVFDFGKSEADRDKHVPERSKYGKKGQSTFTPMAAYPEPLDKSKEVGEENYEMVDGLDSEEDVKFIKEMKHGNPASLIRENSVNPDKLLGSSDVHRFEIELSQELNELNRYDEDNKIVKSYKTEIIDRLITQAIIKQILFGVRNQ